MTVDGKKEIEKKAEEIGVFLSRTEDELNSLIEDGVSAEDINNELMRLNHKVVDIKTADSPKKIEAAYSLLNVIDRG